MNARLLVFVLGIVLLGLAVSWLRQGAGPEWWADRPWLGLFGVAVVALAVLLVRRKTEAHE